MRRSLVVSLILGVAGLGAGCGDDDGTGGGGGGGGAGGGAGGGDGGVSCADPAADGDGVVDVDADIDADTTWLGGCTYSLATVIYVTGGELTIEPGTRVVGADVPAALIVTRDATIRAVGTEDAPIVFTSINPVGERAPQDFGGLVLLGRARVNKNVCLQASDHAPAADNALCNTDPENHYWQSNVEGLPADEPRGQYGGTDDTHDCGTLRYVRVEFGGYGFAADNELNGLTVAGCGSDTDLGYIQVHRGSDDGIELFGGTASMHHVVISGSDDDGLDWDLGFRGNVQFLVVHMFDGLGDHGFESDGHSAGAVGVPASDPTIYNVTMIGGSDNRGMLLREGTSGDIGNLVVTGFGVEPLDVANANTVAAWEAGDLAITNGFFYANGAFHEETATEDDDCIDGQDTPDTADDDVVACPGTLPTDGSVVVRDRFVDDDGGFDEQAELEATAGFDDETDPMIGSTSATSPSYVPAATGLAGQATPPAGDGFFDTTATYAGAFEPNGDDWTAGWTDYPED